MDLYLLPLADTDHLRQRRIADTWIVRARARALCILATNQIHAKQVFARRNPIDVVRTFLICKLPLTGRRRRCHFLHRHNIHLHSSKRLTIVIENLSTDLTIQAGPEIYPGTPPINYFYLELRLTADI